MKKLNQRVALVTGAASGIGEAIARLFAEEGARVFAADVNVPGVRAVDASIEAAGGSATAVETDVAREDHIRRLVDQAEAAHGRVDVLVNNAGIMDDFLPAGEVTDPVWERVLAVNLAGPMRAIRRVLPIFLRQGGGVIVNISSIAGHQGARAGAAYTSSKHALIGLTRNVAFDYAGRGVRCNAIAPGAIATNIRATILHPSTLGNERAMCGFAFNPREGAPVEIARVALFLACDDSSYVNGAMLTADSGWTAY